MKAAVYVKRGGRDVLEIAEIERPTPKDNEVLIEVRAAAVNPLDCFHMPGVARAGVDVAGKVEAVGKNVSQIKAGDEVFGACLRNPQGWSFQAWSSQGAFAEYACIPESELVAKPASVSFEQAACVPLAGLTALQGLRNKGRVRAGQKVLINGASGGVGIFAVQIAKSFGAEVTGVCSTKNLDMVRSIGADQAIDYTQKDFTNMGERYDLIFDCVGNHSLSACRRVLSPNGILVLVGDKSGRGISGMLARTLGALILSRFVSQRLITLLAKPSGEDLAALANLMAARKLIPVIDKRYSLREVPEAIAYLKEGHARGKVLITCSVATGC
jgi:NADPH:quinone reductase-like Zn-dependent oxidoreductase